MSLPASAVVGQKIEIGIDVRNRGAEAIRGAKLTLYLNKALDPKEATEGLSYTDDPNEWYWDILKIDPENPNRLFRVACECVDSGSALPVVAALQMESGAIIEERKTITIRPAGDRSPMPLSGGPTLPEVTETPRLEVSASDLDDPMNVGRETSYHIIVKNTGRTTARNVAVVVNLPRNLRPVSIGTFPEFSIDGQRIKFVPTPTLAPNATQDYRVRARADEPGRAMVEVDVTAQGLEIPVTAKEETEVLAAP